jgi:hypothetical protein
MAVASARSSSVRRAISHSDLPDIDSRGFQRITQEGYVDADAVAAFLSVERRQVLEMTRKGIIPAHPLGTVMGDN